MRTITPTTTLLFKYLALPNALGGRGGVERFFLLSQGIPFAEELYSKGEQWGIEKARLLSTGENPCGTLPVTTMTTSLFVADDKTLGNHHQYLQQHIATCRYLAQVYERTSGDPYQDYVQDLVADEYQGFRNMWVTMSFSGTEEQRVLYRTAGVHEQLNKFNALYGQYKTHDVYLSTNPTTQNPLWGDAAIFGVLRDHSIMGLLSLDDLDRYPHLKALYDSYRQIPAVADWIETKEKSLV
jgi:glutathione S-transferase